MKLYLITIVFVIFENINKIFAQNIPISPCPRFFQYRFDGTEWYGALSVPNTDFNQPLHLRVTLSMRGKPSTNYLGEIELLTRGQFPRDTSVLYKIKFPKTYFPPKLLEIQTNNQVICLGVAEHGYFVTQIQMEHTRKFTYLGGSGVGGGGVGGAVGGDVGSGGISGGVGGYGGGSSATGGVVGSGVGSGVGGSTGGSENGNFPSLLSDVFKIPKAESADSIYDTAAPSVMSNSANIDHKGNHSTHDNFYNNRKRKRKDICGTIHNFMQIDIKNNIRIMTNNNEENHNKPESYGVSTPLITSTDYDPTDDDDDGDDIDNMVDELQEISHGSWPWLAAIYVNNITSLAYQCGGTLVSKTVVISSAHCFQMYKKRYTANEVLVFLGRHNLRNWNEEESVAASVDNIYIHPDFDEYLNSYDADIAVVVLKNEVRFNPYVRPACLWSGSPDERYIYGKHGVVVGWGLSVRNTSSAHSETIPHKIDAPIVSNRACFKANEKFRSLSSNRTFCAGIVLSSLKKKEPAVRIELRSFDTATSSNGRRLKSGPCTGDSGAGLMIFRNNRWTLRGIVSATLPVSDLSVAASLHKNSCFLNQYVIYTDAAKFLDWVLAFII